MNLEGEFRVRWYSDHFSEAIDNRGPEQYLRYAGRLLGKTKLGEKASFTTELVLLTDNTLATTESARGAVRNIGGTGSMKYGVSQIYAEFVQPNILLFDVVRVRAGRQEFPIGDGLSLGTPYIPNKFDGGRLDLSRGPISLTLFGAITGQNLSASGLYPDPGSDQLYVARAGADLFKQNFMVYGMLQKLRGEFNDSYIVGGGSSGQVLLPKLEYSWEAAYQKFNTVPGLPEKGGLGYMLSANYQWSLDPFRTMKLETRYAAYQGDDPSTRQIEQFSPLFPSFYWGSRTGYVDGDVGGDYPHNGVNLEGCRIWFTRFYVVPKVLPRARVQVQYVHVSEWNNFDSNNSMDDEAAVRLYYSISPQVQLQFRYGYTFPNDTDHDLDANGRINSSEDRYNVSSFMLETQVRF